jgi:hypothetical protein
VSHIHNKNELYFMRKQNKTKQNEGRRKTHTVNTDDNANDVLSYRYTAARQTDDWLFLPSLPGERLGLVLVGDVFANNDE